MDDLHLFASFCKVFDNTKLQPFQKSKLLRFVPDAVKLTIRRSELLDCLRTEVLMEVCWLCGRASVRGVQGVQLLRFLRKT